MDKYLDELFAPPIGLKPAYSISGTTFYSSDTLKTKFILAFEKSSKGKHVSSEVQKLIDKDVIIPCYKSKNIFSFMKHKLTSGAHKYISAFYAIEDKKVIVIIDNSATIFGSSSNNEIASTTMHECMHLAAGRNLSKFVQIFSPKLRAYYSEFFMDYLKLQNIQPKKIDDFIKYMTKGEKNGPLYVNKNLNILYRMLETMFASTTKLDNQEFTVRLTNLVVAIKLFILSFSSLIKNARKFSMIFTSLNQAYFKAFGEKNKYTFPIQEMISMSEVACVLSEMKPKDPVIKKLFQIIA